LSCARGHSYDVARSGYINLLQPQDRKSLAAGDSAAAVAARGRLLTAGIGRRVITELVAAIDAMPLAADAVVVDLGSGTGDTLEALSRKPQQTGIGIDLSTAAARHAARRFPHLTWVVANADRRLPLVDRRVALIASLHGRRNPHECARVLMKGGVLFVAAPAPDDLIELRTTVLGHGAERSRIETIVEEHREWFDVVDRFSVREQHSLGPSQLKDILQSTYRGARHRVRENVAALTTLVVTFTSDCVVFHRM
jgi:23S rRNA (guanine745-N1)-methyltransferase